METALELDLEEDIALQKPHSAISEYELERGKPMPNRIHSFAQSNLIAALTSRYKKRKKIFSELTIEVGEARATPDIAIYPYYELDWTKRVPAAETEPPLVAIEIISPSQTLVEMLDKADMYFAHGVKSCWIVQPELQIISVLHPDEPPKTFTQGMVRDSAVDIEIPIEEVFE
ncbi:MAG: Uma2 family endonuclease [Candidatus Kapaibacterium sp.]|nr:MAG: Uma2 family endonuclease [Candidatus Kapabacteria bacterium]